MIRASSSRKFMVTACPPTGHVQRDCGPASSWSANGESSVSSRSAWAAIRPLGGSKLKISSRPTMIRR